MIKPESKIVDDVARLAGGAIGVFSELRHSVQSDAKERVEQIATRLDLVPREDFERLERVVQAQADEIAHIKNLVKDQLKNQVKSNLSKKDKKTHK